jgi:hypothetical protein
MSACAQKNKPEVAPVVSEDTRQSFSNYWNEKWALLEPVLIETGYFLKIPKIDRYFEYEIRYRSGSVVGSKVVRVISTVFLKARCQSKFSSSGVPQQFKLQFEGKGEDWMLITDNGYPVMEQKETDRASMLPPEIYITIKSHFPRQKERWAR